MYLFKKNLGRWYCGGLDFFIKYFSNVSLFIVLYEYMYLLLF